MLDEGRSALQQLTTLSDPNGGDSGEPDVAELPHLAGGNAPRAPDSPGTRGDRVRQVTGMDDSFDLELAAASLRAEGSDVRILVKVLVDQLSDALGPRLKVERAGRFRKSEEIRSLRIAMEDDQFDAEVDGNTLRCTIAHSSGGIRIRSEKVDMDTWLNRLLTVLKAEAANSQAVRLALENMVIGGPG